MRVGDLEDGGEDGGEADALGGGRLVVVHDGVWVVGEVGGDKDVEEPVEVGYEQVEFFGVWEGGNVRAVV